MFALVFDGWSEADTHSAAIFATYPCTSPLRYDCDLLSFCLLEDETDHSAQQHKKLLRYTVGLFGKCVSNVFAIIADNSPTNRRLASNLFVLFVGCASPRYDFSVEDIIKENKAIIEDIKKIVSKIGTLRCPAKLREFIEYAPGKSNDTRFTAVRNMLKQYVLIPDHLL